MALRFPRKTDGRAFEDGTGGRSAAEVNGLKAADEISKLLPGVRIVLHTIYGAGVVLEANRHGIFRVVEKAKSGGTN